MGQAQAVRIEPQRQGQEPVGSSHHLRCGKPERLEDAAVLVTVLVAVSAQPAMEQHRVQFMIAHDRDGTVVDQAAHAGQDDAIAGPLPSSVDEVAQEGQRAVSRRKCGLQPLEIGAAISGMTVIMDWSSEVGIPIAVILREAIAGFPRRCKVTCDAVDQVGAFDILPPLVGQRLGSVIRFGRRAYP
jgi:hypothetical protein